MATFKLLLWCQGMAASAPVQGDSCEFGSPKYFALCGLGGILSCGKLFINIIIKSWSKSIEDVVGSSLVLGWYLYNDKWLICSTHRLKTY